MPQFTTRRLVRHTPEQMFDLVADVERYPEFLPLCESLVVRARDTNAKGHERIECQLTVGYGLMRETFITEVVLKRAAWHIDVRYLEGPFRTLNNTWDFRPLEPGCEVAFFIDYEFRSLPLQLLMGAMFDRAFRKFAEAFEARANAIHGGAVG
jgi:coenzyme Q-binding protein COQ10